MMDEKTITQYGHFYMRCVEGKETYQKIRDDFIASNLSYPNPHAISNCDKMMRFTGAAIRKIDPSSRKMQRWLQENLWGDAPPPPRFPSIRYWPGDPSLPHLPEPERCNNPVCRDTGVVNGLCPACGRKQ